MRHIRLAFGPLLLCAMALPAGCDLAPPLPSCPDGSALATDAEGQPLCSALPLRQPLPACDPETEALSTQGGQLSCAPRLMPSAEAGDPPARFALLEDQLARGKGFLDGLPALRGAAVFVGTSTMKLPGNGGLCACQWPIACCR